MSQFEMQYGNNSISDISQEVKDRQLQFAILAIFLNLTAEIVLTWYTKIDERLPVIESRKGFPEDSRRKGLSQSEAMFNKNSD